MTQKKIKKEKNKKCGNNSGIFKNVREKRW